MAALLLAATSLVHPPEAHAEDPASSTAPLLTIEAAEAGNGLETLLLTARLVGADGAPIGGQRITFLVAVDLPGAELLLIGSKTTDDTGQARLKYVPTWTGEHRLVADAGRVGSGPAVTGTLSVEVGWLPGAYIELPRVLQPLEVHLTWIVGATVIAVWLALAVITVQTIYGIAHTGRGEASPPSQLERQGPR